jgi:hypothetical protein
MDTLPAVSCVCTYISILKSGIPSKIKELRFLMDNLHNRLNLDSGKKNKIYQHSSKVHLETTKIAKFGIDILQYIL